MRENFRLNEFDQSQEIHYFIENKNKLNAFAGSG